MLAAGLDTLRRAVLDARGLSDRHPLARALVTLGSALVHAARGTDEEGAAVLLEGGRLAIEADDPTLASTAYREFGYVALLRGQYQRSLAWLETARNLANGDAGHLAWIDLVAGKAYTDLGRHASARERLATAIAAASQVGNRRCESFAQASVGRLLIQREERDGAGAVLTMSLQLAKAEAWLSFRPYPEALLGEVSLADGDLDAADTAFDNAYALGRQIGDPCWESLAERGAGLVAIRRGITGAGSNSSPRHRRHVDNYPTPINGSPVMGRRRETTLQSTTPPPLRPGGSRSWRRSPPGTSCGNCRPAPPSSAYGSVSPVPSRWPRALVADVDNPALSALLNATS